MSGAEARRLVQTDAFRSTVKGLQDVANRATPGLGTRAGTQFGKRNKSNFNDIVLLGFARALKIPFATADRTFYNFVVNQAKKWAADIILF